jgi:RNA polymerase sigma-70 factor (sigma-E family)
MRASRRARKAPMTIGTAGEPDPRRGRIGLARETAEDPLPSAGGDELAEPTLEDYGDRLVADLYRDHGLRLVRAALLLVGDKPTAEDVVQEAFIGLYRGLHRLTSPDKALAYLRVSVVNGCRSVNRTRRQSRQHMVEVDQPVWSAESVVMAQEDSRQTLRAIARLPRRSREVLALRYYLDLSDPDIAAVLGVSRGTVSSTASRALVALARELKEEQ